jgi:uncharacterized membrane protein
MLPATASGRDVNSRAWSTRGYVALFVLSLGVAGYAAVVYSLFPVGTMVHPDMRAGFESQRAGVYAHVFPSAVALVLGPLQFSTRLRSAYPGLHRVSGRLYLGVGVLIGGLAGLYLSLHAHGGLVGRLGFAGLALAWLITGLRAYQAIRRHDLSAHRRWMVRNFALTFAAVTLRLWLPWSMAAGVPFGLAYPVIAWLCWVPNLIVAEWVLKRTPHPASLALDAAGSGLRR